MRCEHCGRQFNPHSAARHIPWCAKQQSDSKRHKPSAEKRQALERYKWRIGYKPSNVFHPAGGCSKFAPGNQPRASQKSSINSSSNFSSSLSASSTNSAGSNCIIDGSAQARRHRQQPASQPARKQAHQVPASSLKRSISSLTMTKQPAGSKAAQADQLSLSSSASSQQQQLRAKSHADLRQLDMVESLARRVEDIYAQNELLLANLSLKSAQGGPAGFECEPACCHHCKASCLAGANYCHRCGCKLYTSPGSGVAD